MSTRTTRIDSTTYSETFSEALHNTINRGGESTGTSSGSFSLNQESFSSEFRATLVQTDAQSAHRHSSRRKDFKLATLRHEKVGYYGRESELVQLQACMNRLTESSTQDTHNAPPGTTSAKYQTELVLISGFSGTGKTALARQVKLPPGAAFVLGKCDWNAREEPYSSIAEACETLCHQMNQNQDMDATAKARDVLLDQLSVEIMGYLWDLIPSLRPLIMHTTGVNSDNTNERTIEEVPSTLDVLCIPDTNENASTLNAKAKRQQMNHAFRVLIRVFSSCYRPLILCLDDLQWSDASTLELIQLLLTDVDHNQLLIIGCYRSNEVDELLSQSLTTLRNLASTDIVHVTEIELSNLSVQHCNAILMDLLSMQHDDPLQTQPLAAICHKRTLGNINFFLQFIVMLQETQLLDFNLGLLQWQWDIETIEAETHAADNVLAVVERRMAQLTPELRRFLSVASSIGATASLRILELAWATVAACTSNNTAAYTSSFRVDTLGNVSSISQSPKASLLRKRGGNDDDGVNNGGSVDEATSVLDCIREAIKANFMEPCGKDKYKFVHDKIQEAAGKLLPQDQNKREQFAIGMNLIHELTGYERYSEIFLIRDLLDSKENPSEKEAETIVRINLLASKRARSVSAFQSSLTYAKKGLSLLSDQAWEAENYKTTLELHCLACEAAEFTAQPALLEELSELVLARQDCPFLDKLRVYKVRMDKMANDGDPDSLKRAIRLLINLLHELDCKVPWRSVVPLSVISSLLRFKSKVPREGNLRALPRLVDQAHVESMYLLYRLQGYAYFQGDIMLSTWAALKIATTTLQHGRNEISSTSFPAIGMAMTGLFGEFQKGELYAHLGEVLVEMEDNKSKEGRTAFTLVPSFVYTRPVQSQGKMLLTGYKKAMQAGDTESAMFCLGHHCWLGFMSGKSLHYLEADCHRYLAQAKQLHRLNGVYFLSPLAELVSRLTDSGLGIETYLDNKTSDLLVDHLELARTISYAYLGRYKDGADIYIRRGSAYDSTYPAMPIGMWNKFLAGVCLYDAAINTNRRRYRKHANAVRAIIHSWAKKGNPNANHHACLLDAEFYRMKKDFARASKFYENAAIMAGRTGLLHDAALAQERYAIHMLTSKAGSNSEALFRLEKAVTIYSEWGAVKKVHDLKVKFKKLLNQQSLSTAHRE